MTETINKSMTPETKSKLVDVALKTRTCKYCKGEIKKGRLHMKVNIHVGKYPISINICIKCLEVVIKYIKLIENREAQNDN